MKVQIIDDGKITIPLEIRQRLGLREGDELLFSLEGNEVRLRPVKRRRLSEFRGALPTTVAYPGKDAIRRQVAKTLATDTEQS
ncbi:AbrB/MazE/SpoVT family DNA-binding domain-containing protein [Leptolyngbya sp. FACHB-321]|uniref:AbrB/MazE/SpoVT family DNA-binding domain-containing protein n=1 Tax=Leptolyngbya sp. FACHB-321 TaxID=2692807 RepID=UPI001684C288|nr:AbrB/MazE/SpoVT family DNA-binding domain-containing protein [Leptolyngbya sp. FACHB-321]MBD2036242.1 AbrB/MazE/SpoVT family DNA-binding domain-containing protein [Leptolyngbya sp. FACHB-321]